ncbi:thioredoxin family protein [Luteolibacter sp. LG18]|uniref:thioredoxin family protein n=1 Tax=Luteolibacter sp. LG18 TaxID=2819286 RepID=UPI002B2C2616|nr:hypothetical protein llg_05630 [Luteolibacter sp. LG18]
MKFRLTSATLAASLLVSALHAASAESPFTDDLAAARTRAKEQHKDILVDFTGSDWCGWCVKLDQEVFHKPEFKAEATKGFELVQLDFPHDPAKQSAEITARNKAWKNELKSMSFPDILLLDETGRVFARTGYREGGATAFLGHLESLRQRRIQRDAALAQATKAEGVEKAKHLDAALTALRDDDVLLTYYRAELEQILTLASRDEGGLQGKYQAVFRRQACEREIDRLGTGNDGAAMLARYKDYAARTDIPVESRQYALYMAGALACERVLKDPQQALDLIDQATALAPDSPLAQDRIKQARTRLERKLAAAPVKPAGKPAAGS